MTQGSEWQGGGGVEARLGPETIPVLKMVLQSIPIIAGLVPTLTPTLQWGWDVSPSLHTPTSGQVGQWPLENDRALSSLEPWSGAGRSSVVRKNWFSHKALLEMDKPYSMP